MTAALPAHQWVIDRGRSDVALLVLGCGVLLLTAWPVDAGRVPGAEAAVFRVLNGTTVLPFVIVWPVMQLGNVAVVPVSAFLAAAFRRWRLAAELLVAGTATYVAAKVVKGIWPRGRPDSLLAEVVIRGDAALGRGFVSGHAATLTALAAVAWPWLGPRGRAVVLVSVVLVCLARVHVGAHLPLDVVGGAALGLAVGGLVRLVLGRPA
ncbi:MAG TPA: phosphatase PAP2 family protein [Blastococcus sp.]